MSGNSGNPIDRSRQLREQTRTVQSAGQELTDLQTEFSSTLERYKTAHAQLMSTTKNYLKDNAKISDNAILNKNVYVNTIVSNPQSDYLGAYNDPTASVGGVATSNGLTKISGRNFNFSQCQDAAINNEKRYFALSNVDTAGTGGDCSVGSTYSAVTSSGQNIPKCSTGSDGKYYGGDLANALYSSVGSSINYLGCYLDSASSRSMTTSGPVLSSYPSVYVCGDYNIGPWGVRDFLDKSAKWIWYTRNAQRNAPNNVGSPVTLIGSFNFTGSRYTNASIYGICDNASSVYLNGALVGRIDGGWGGGGRGIRINVVLPPGLNYISVEVQNMGGPAGLLLSILDSSNRSIVNTNSSWKYTQIRASNLIPNRQDYSVAKCGQYAKSNGFQYFGLQGGTVGNSQCYVSNNLANAQKYGSAASTQIGGDNRLYGRSAVNAAYQVQDIGHKEYLGKLGYIDNYGVITQYPNTLYGTTNNVPTILLDISSCSKEIVNVDSNFWSSKTISSTPMTRSTKCGLSKEIQADQASVADLGAQLSELSSELIEVINYLEALDSTVIEQMGINKNYLDNILEKYIAYNRQFSKYNNVDYISYDNILKDSELVASEHNYGYILWSGIAVIVLLLTIQLLKKGSA